jgi:hypothetical protein
MPDAQDTQDPQYAQTLQWARDQLASLQAQPKIDTTGSPNDGTRPSWTGLLGDVLSGGQGPGYQLRGQEADTAGNRALLNFGINMLLASGPQRVKPDLLSAAATGLQGAQQSLDVDQRRGALAAGAQQEYAQKQQEMQIARIKEAVPLLTLLQQSQSADAARRLAGSGATPPAAGGGNIATGVDSATRKAGEGGPPAPGTPGAAVAQQVHDFWRGQGYTEEQTAGIMAGGPGSESDFTPTVYGDKGTSYGLYQHHGPRLDAMRQHFGLTGSQMPSADQQNQYAAFELSPQGPLAKVGEQLRAAKTPAEAAAIFTAGFGVPADKTEIARRAGGAGRFLGPYTQAQAPAGGGVVARNPGAVQVAGPGAGTPPAAPTTDLTGPRPLPPIGPGSGVATPASIANTPAQTAQAQPPPAPVATPTQPTTPPPSPYPDIKAGEGLIRYPGMSKEYFDREYVPPPQSEVYNPNLSPEKLAEFAIRQQGLDLKLRQVSALTDPSKGLIEVKAEQAALAAERQAAADAKKTAADKALVEYNKTQDERIQKRYEQEKGAYNTAAQEAQKASETRLTNREAVFNKANETGLVAAQKEQAESRDKVAALEGFQAISGGVGQPGWLQTTKIPGSDKSIAEQLGQLGMPLSDTSGVQLLHGAMTNLTRELRSGLAMGTLSDRDLDFVARLGPTDWMDPDTRAAAVGYLQQAYRAKMRFTSDLQKEMSRGKNYGDAFDAADAKQKPFVPSAPADITAHWTDNSPEWAQKRLQWAQQNEIRPGTLFHLSDGSIHIAKTPKPPRQP